MIHLPNGCRCSEPAVSPKNWRSPRASLSKKWFIHYRFYQPDQPVKQVVIAGMNRYKDLLERQSATKLLLDQELDLLTNKGYNPRTGRLTQPGGDQGALGPDMPLAQALPAALARVVGVNGTLIDMRSACRTLVASAEALDLDQLPICEVSRRHIKSLLDQCAKINPRWSAHRHNKYRAYLSRLFRELLEIEAVSHNPVRDVSKAKEIRQLRELLTQEEQRRIDQLRDRNYNFWRYILVFYYSGARSTELLNLQVESVDLVNQEFRVLVKKGYRQHISRRAISDEALPLWAELIREAKAKDYVFSRNLKPGPKSIRPDQINRRWNKYVKGELGIQKDFYCLKHTHTDEIAKRLDIDHAAAAAGHTTPVVTMKHYAVNEKGRQLDRLKKSGIRFG